MSTLIANKATSFETDEQPRWEWVRCNLCGRDEPELYHREQLPYFNQLLDFDIVRCKCCGLVYTNPRLAYHNATYLRDSGDNPEQIERHARAKERIFKGALDEIISRQQKKSLGSLLDVGCGSGHFAAHARKRGFEVLGIEPAATAADYAARVMDIPVINQEAGKVELPAEGFDVITAWDVIEHVGDPQALMKRCVGWLRPGGIMALRFPSASWQKIKGTILHGLLSSSRSAFSATIHLYFFSEDTFRQMANRAGLEILQTKTTGFEINSASRVFDGIKIVSDRLLRGIETLSGKHLGNLEVYCRKTPDTPPKQKEKP